jgi:hypothetical protein
MLLGKEPPSPMLAGNRRSLSGSCFVSVISGLDGGMKDRHDSGRLLKSALGPVVI